MAKRKSYGGDGIHAGKKQKTSHIHEAPTSEEVYTARQLRHLLTFEQDLQKARHGLQSFKNVLDSIVNNDEKKSEHMQILLEFLESSKPREIEDEVPVYLPDIMETWSMASQMNNENVMSAVPVVLALLLKVVSANLDQVSYGLGVCRTLLQKRQQELIARNLSADKGKDFVISPTLRLLREAICLDGGALAAPIFRARINTFRSLARNLGLKYIGSGKEDPKRASVRTNATRLLLSCLKLLHNEAKRDLLLQRDIVAALMRHLRDDPPFLISEILDVLKTSVVQDKKLAKEVKIKILNAYSLTQIASLYGYSREPTDSEDGTETRQLSVEDAAHEILLATCTDSAVGICRSQQGYYPEGIAADALVPDTEGADRLDFGLDSIPWMNKFTDDVPVRNMLLGEFIESLRPWSNIKQSELLLAIFSASPELIAPYFIHKKTFTFDPKLSATWIGYASLLYSVVKMPIPPFFGQSNDYAAVPPPTSVVLDNIIPPPMTLKAINRCLTNKSKLISFYAIRLLIVALEKLDRALIMHREASTSPNSIWQEASRRLVDNFYQRIPDIKDIINYYRTLADGDFLQREAASRLILLYYEVIPQLALKAKFDVSPILLATIQKVEASNGADEDAAISLLELEHLCAVAQYSPSMRWFGRVAELPTSPFTTLLRLYTEKTTTLSGDTLSQILSYVANEYQLVESNSQSSGLNPLIAALRNAGSIDLTIWSFIDNCAERCSRTPTKYLEMIEQHVEGVDAVDQTDTRTCPLLMSIAEQLPFLVSTSPAKETLKQLAAFLRDYLRRSLESGVSRLFLKSISRLLVTALNDKKLSSKITLPKRTSSLDEDTDMLESEPEPKLQSPAENKKDSVIQLSPQELEDKLAVPMLMSKENDLLRWSSKPPEELVEEGHGASLILLLSSEHASIRQEALTNVLKMAAKIKESTYEENEQIWLLLMELAESAKDLIAEAPLPSILVVFACRALDILKTPLHCLYEKVNLFLTSGPVWQPKNIPLLKAILQEGPTLDGSYYTEISWLLGFLVDSLRTPQDIALFHQRKVYERLFALVTNPYMGINLRTQVLRVLYRTTCISGGSDTVITRFGAVSWLVAQKAATADGMEKRLYQAMIRRLWETCDQKRIAIWSRGTVEKLVQG
ncbi:ribosome 60S biogenesis N-terminal-domain-containing protein [Xylaria bambusicola]|uniref:ribosome 60S biogenesis N-terminal-domain-containing protein n=1 Tax=Xylaria bambusicola TaxID=326684 RepID=UPI0020072330|nr:ribosome 60S biogenesis N-terminal-domain-containing protein [Xylaria bambusicola]KAI0520912.1 ribosome 60S biogenesis N-terminal-domain-containing protein [Xylaria bambusicola]